MIGIHYPLTKFVSPLVNAETKLKVVGNLLSAGGCDVVFAKNIDAARWEKNLWCVIFFPQTHKSL